MRRRMHLWLCNSSLVTWNHISKSLFLAGRSRRGTWQVEKSLTATTHRRLEIDKASRIYLLRVRLKPMLLVILSAVLDCRNRPWSFSQLLVVHCWGQSHFLPEISTVLPLAARIQKLFVIELRIFLLARIHVRERTEVRSSTLGMSFSSKKVNETTGSRSVSTFCYLYGSFLELVDQGKARAWTTSNWGA